MVSSTAVAARVTIQDPPASSSAPPPFAAVVQVPSGLVACDFAEIRAPAHQALQFLDKAKTTVEEQDNMCLD
jgi:hypothetical protein